MMASSDCVSFHVSKLSRQKLNDETVRSVGPALESAHLPWSALILVAARSFATGGPISAHLAKSSGIRRSPLSCRRTS